MIPRVKNKLNLFLERLKFDLLLCDETLFEANSVETLYNN